MGIDEHTPHTMDRFCPRGDIGIAKLGIFLQKCRFKAVGQKLLAATIAFFYTEQQMKSQLLGSFLSLVLSGCLFFGAYGLVLVILRERLTNDILSQMLRKFVNRGK